LPFAQILHFANRTSGIAHFFCLAGPRYFCHFVVLLILPSGRFCRLSAGKQHCNKGWSTQAVQSTDKKPKRAPYDTFSDAIFAGECSVEIEHYPRRSFRKVGKQHRNKGQPRHRCFVLFSLHAETFQSQSNLTRPSISLFGHNLGLL